MKQLTVELNERLEYVGDEAGNEKWQQYATQRIYEPQHGKYHQA